jgi:DNA-directed RNA polymerase subunit L
MLLSGNGTDPSQTKKQAKKEVIEKTENIFENIAREWHKKQSEDWTSSHANKVLRRL